jgi:hypothetical protein
MTSFVILQRTKDGPMKLNGTKVVPQASEFEDVQELETRGLL